MVFRFARRVGIIPLTGPSERAHMAEDLACRELALTDEEVDAIERVAPS